MNIETCRRMLLNHYDKLKFEENSDENRVRLIAKGVHFKSFDDDGSRFLIGISKKVQGHKRALTESDQKALKKSVEAPADHSIHIAAIEGAYDDFIENWELTFREYPNLLTTPENWKRIEKCADNLQRYLDFIRSKHLKMLESQRQGG